MNKTRVDDMLIEMITPKIKEIETKFSNGQGLNQDDINTLLLKSQYNHINHLDQNLDEVVADVASLKSDFKIMEQKIETTIQTALNKNMMQLIAIMVLFVVASKLIDKLL